MLLSVEDLIGNEDFSLFIAVTYKKIESGFLQLVQLRFVSAS